MAKQDQGSFSKLIELSRLKGPETVDLTAPVSSRAAIAARLGVPSVDALSGVITITPTAEGAFIEGAIDAVLGRQCVVTLEPIEERIAERFSIRFARGSELEPEIELDLDEDWTEPLTGDMLDVADILVQQIALAMDPYPRKPGAEAPASLRPSAEEVSPFAALKTLKRGDDTKA